MGEMGSSAASTVTKTRASFHGLVLWQRIILTEQKGEKRSKKKVDDRRGKAHFSGPQQYVNLSQLVSTTGWWDIVV